MRTILFNLDDAESIFASPYRPNILIVDVEGTLTPFSPSQELVIEATDRFDQRAMECGIDLSRIYYVTNSDYGSILIRCPRLIGRIYSRAHKPFFRLPAEFVLASNRPVVVGDQYLTDGLMAWRYGVPFGLVKLRGVVPPWPRLQLALGRMIEPLLFRRAPTP
jgi:predicted HAD superfamily phosphohydrolase YqeG